MTEKISSRAGRFKKKLVSEEDLKQEASEILKRLAPFQDLYTSQKLSPADFVCAYLIVYLSYRHPGGWLGSYSGKANLPGTDWRTLPFVLEPNVKKRLENINSLTEIFASFSLKATPKSVNRSIINWHENQYGLELMFRIPSPAEVLGQQKIGRRCVTTILDQRISRYILGERDALSFTMHDLIHADHFYQNHDCYRGQLGFYGLLDKTLGYFDLSNEPFAREFEYVIADMNAYAIHLLKCLKSAMIHYFDEDYFRGWAINLNPPVALYALNTTDYLPELMDIEILSWLDQYRQI